MISSSDIILSSQLDEEENHDTFFSALSVFADNGVFSLTLSEEDSDWESDEIFACKDNCKKERNVVDYIFESNFSGSNYVCIESASNSEDLFTTEGEADTCRIDDSQSQFENHKEILPSLTDKSSFTSPLLKCETAYTQEEYDSCSLQSSNSDQLLEDGCSNSDYSQIIGLVKSSETRDFSDLSAVDINLPIHNLIACVIICYPVREIWCKTRRCWESISTILIGDFSNKYYKIVLWGKQCEHSFSQRSGNLIFISNAHLKTFRTEVFLSLKCFSQIVTVCNLPSLQKMPTRRKCDVKMRFFRLIERNYNWLTNRHTILCSSFVKDVLYSHSTQTRFQSFADLTPGEVVHLTVRLASMQCQSKSNNDPFVVCVYSKVFPGIYRNLYLNGSSRSWVHFFKKYFHHSWEIRSIACCLASFTDDVELHTTVFSSAECKFDECD